MWFNPVRYRALKCEFGILSDRAPSVSVSPPFALAKCTWTDRGRLVFQVKKWRLAHVVAATWMAEIAGGALSLTVLFSLLLPSEARIPLLPDKRHKPPPSVRRVPIWYSFSAAPFSLPLFLPLSSHPSLSPATTNLFTCGGARRSISGTFSSSFLFRKRVKTAT